jgi:hypothetical protein
MATDMAQYQTVYKTEITTRNGKKCCKNNNKILCYNSTNIINNNTNYRVENYTNIHSTREEIQLLSKVLKYNLHHKYRRWIETLALEAETAISKLDIREQNYYRHAVARKIKGISWNYKVTNKKKKEEWKLLTK